MPIVIILGDEIISKIDDILVKYDAKNCDGLYINQNPNNTYNNKMGIEEKSELSFPRIKQNWWHIGCIFTPQPGHNIRQVMDIHIPLPNNNDILNPPIRFNIPNQFIGLRIYARNANNKEIAFLEGEGNVDKNKIILIPILKLDDFPIITNKNVKYAHIKLEMEYILPNSVISNIKIAESFSQNIWILIKSPKKFFKSPIITIQLLLKSLIFNSEATGYLSVDNLICDNAQFQPEFYITVPLGWRISKRGERCLLEAIINDNMAGGTKSEIIKLGQPAVFRLHDNKRKYNYFPTNAGSKLYMENVGHIDSMGIYYSASLSQQIRIFSTHIPIILNIIAIICFGYSIFSDCKISTCLAISISFSILFLAYYYTYITLLHQGYAFMSKKFIDNCILIAGIIDTVTFIAILIAGIKMLV